MNLDNAEAQNRKLIFLDEVNFTKKSIQTVDWSAKRDNQHDD